MIEQALKRRQASLQMKITVKMVVSVGVIALAVVLPQMMHLAFGASAGVRFLPMYLPVLLGGCLLGWRWGVGVGALSPLVSYWLTSSVGAPMPALARLPFMMAELAVFALVAGLFAKQIEKNAWMAFPAVWTAQIGGRAAFMLLIVLFGRAASFTPAMIWSQIQTGFVGLAIQAVLVPLLVMGLKRAMERDKH